MDEQCSDRLHRVVLVHGVTELVVAVLNTAVVPHAGLMIRTEEGLWRVTHVVLETEGRHHLNAVVMPQAIDPVVCTRGRGGP